MVTETSSCCFLGRTAIQMEVHKYRVVRYSECSDGYQFATLMRRLSPKGRPEPTSNGSHDIRLGVVEC
jgi:SET domain-containing protein